MLATLVVVAGVSGCSNERDEAVQAAAQRFYGAYAERDGGAACDQLAPRTKRALEQSAGTPCAEAILEETLPPVESPTDVRVFGTQAQLRWGDETTFLARFQGGWRVTAAACRPQPGRPYDCTISGG